MKYLIISLVFFLFHPGMSAQTVAYKPVDDRCLNQISITGETNINNFHLEQKIDEDLVCGPDDTNWIRYPGENYYAISIPVRSFNTHNKFIYKDFLDLVNASEYPYITIRIEERQFNNFYRKRSSSYQPLILISLAGVTQSYKVKCTVSDCSYGEKTISGAKVIKLTDFKLEPPVKSLGLIKVKNELNINFEFKLPEDKISLN